MPILNRSKLLTATGISNQPCRGARHPAAGNPLCYAGWGRLARRDAPFLSIRNRIEKVTSAMPGLTLFQRDDCHLCDLALDVLAQARVPEFESVFIDGDDALEACYGARVPVLRDAGRETELD